MKNNSMMSIAVLLLFGCSNGGGKDSDTASGSVTAERKYSVCECVNEPIRSGEKAEACGNLAQTLPNYVTQVMACKGETVKE
ncbi:MAG: hypothetical protein KZQ94_11730 [Candidatus Thiodiazotropha sp. (ex Troendleina suluensis)]|nr:hypothetical protein [Candidatus Thiodiazotropha sp. (ex Troendleina suluensis)]MCU7946790.1 hypothetical protein [Candidatus Thiodiazotropha sp. (ex Cardiolucina cf. quadrata)]